MKEIQMIEEKFKKDDIAKIHPGDTVVVHVKIEEGGKTRVQRFEGIVIAIKGSGAKRTFTVRKVSQGVGVERIFPLYSPNITKIQVKKRGDVRRAKLYYLRGKKGKEARIKEKR